MSSPRYRYGLFLRPPAALARIQAQVHALLRAQYGLVSAGNFPPHMTILGHVAIEAPDDEVIAASAAAMTGVSPVSFYNRGVAPSRGGVIHDVGRLQTGEPNRALLELFRRAKTHLDPLRVPVPGEYKGGVNAEAGFYGHMSLAAHDLGLRPDLAEEVLQYLLELSIDARGNYLATTASLYRFETDDWNGRWWEQLAWTHLKSFPLTASLSCSGRPA